MISYYADPDLTHNLLSFIHRRESGENVRLYLAEGDSWFSFGGATSNLLMGLDSDDILIVSCASPGDTMRNISRLGNEPFWLMLDPQFGVKWDGVLISAGGNDLLADIGLLLEGQSLSKALLRIALDHIEFGYWRVINAVRKYQDCPIHAHTYDYPVSDPYGGWFRAGPWIGDELLAHDIPEARHDQIITDIIDALATRLHSLKPLTVHDTRGTLFPGKWRIAGWQKHWKNEIHPTAIGYDLLSAKWRL